MCMCFIKEGLPEKELVRKMESRTEKGKQASKAFSIEDSLDLVLQKNSGELIILRLVPA